MSRDEVIDTWQCPSGSGRRYLLLRRTWPEGFSKPVLVEEGDNEHELSASMAKQILAARLLKVVECTPWRDCKTDPPPTKVDSVNIEKSSPVTVVMSSGSMCIATFSRDHFDPEEDERVEAWHTADSEWWNITDEVAYWLPLPAPPRELQEQHAAWMES